MNFVSVISVSELLVALSFPPSLSFPRPSLFTFFSLLSVSSCLSLFLLLYFSLFPILSLILLFTFLSPFLLFFSFLLLSPSPLTLFPFFSLQGLFRKVVLKQLSPRELVRMSSEMLASEELSQWREQTIKKVGPTAYIVLTLSPILLCVELDSISLIPRLLGPGDKSGTLAVSML